MKHFTIPVFVPQKGCPFQCIFCSQVKITGKTNTPSPGQVGSIIETHLAMIPREDSRIELGFFGGNFTGIPLSEQVEYFEAVKPFLIDGRIDAIRLSTRPDYISEEILKLLRNFHVETIELGAQSMDNDVLKQSARGHTAEDTENASGKIIAHGFRLGLQMMIGLPGDTLEKSMYTARRIVALGAAETRVYPALVIRGTKLEEWYREGKYEPLSLDQAVHWLSKILPVFEKAGVEVTRVGLHSSVSVDSGKELVAGPYHASVRELAMSEVWWDRLKRLGSGETGGNIRISVHPSQYNFAIGYYGKNRKRLLEHFVSADFVKDEKLKSAQFHVDHY